MLNVKNDAFKEPKLKVAKDFIDYKLKQYQETLEKLVREQTIKKISLDTLTSSNRMSQDFLAKVGCLINENH